MPDSSSHLLIVHVSDMHITSGSSVLSRCKPIAATLAPQEKPPLACILAISGDITRSGKLEECNLASEWIVELRQELAHRLRSIYAGKEVPVRCVAVVGNHDCYLQERDPIRDKLIAGALDSASTALDPEVVAYCLRSQAAVNELIEATSEIGEKTPLGLGRIVELQLGEFRVGIFLLNSAWMYRREHPGGIVMPLSEVVRPVDCDFAVFMMHHTLNWYEPETARDLRSRIDNEYALLLTGHEHDHESFRRSRTNDKGVVCIEGGLLYGGSEEPSDFSLLDIDLCLKQLRSQVYQFDTRQGSYLPDPARAATLAIGNSVHSATPRPTEKFSEWLGELGMPIAHRKRQPLRLDDVFVSPVFLPGASSDAAGSATYKIEDVVQRVVEGKRVVISGPPLSGRTSVLKQLATRLLRRGFLPVVVAGATERGVRQTPLATMQSAARVQYGPEYDRFVQSPQTRKVLLIDDMARLCDSVQSMRAFLEKAHEQFERVVAVVEIATVLEDLSSGGSAPSALLRYDRLTIEPFGLERRDRLIEQWIGLDPAVDQNSHALMQEVAGTSQMISLLIDAGRIPSYPLFVLCILSSKDVFVASDMRNSAEGNLVEMLIKVHLYNKVGKESAEFALNALSVLALHMFGKRVASETAERATRVIDAFIKERILSRSATDTLKLLVESAMVAVENGEVTFTHRFCYHYFVARHLGRNIHDPQRVEDVKWLCHNVHVEDNANILVFLGQITSNPLVITELLGVARSVYPEHPRAELASDSLMLGKGELVTERVQYEDREFHEGRKQVLERADAQSRAVRGTGAADDAHPQGEDSASAAEELRAFAGVRSGYHAVMVLGQILRSYPAEISGPLKREMMDESVGAVLRTLSFLDEVFTANRPSIEQMLGVVATRNRERSEKDEIERQGRRAYEALMMALAYGVVRHVGRCFAGTESVPLFDERLAGAGNSGSESVIALNGLVLSSEAFPASLVEAVYQRFHDKPLILQLIRIMTVQRFNLFPVPFKTRQHVCDKLDVRFRSRLGGTVPKQ